MNAGEEFTDYYQVLHVDMDASDADIKKAYFNLAKQSHPDAGGTTEDMQVLNRAYKILKDDTKRAVYDKLYSLHNNVVTSSLDLKEDDYAVTTEGTKVDEGLEDYFVDQLYSEYYEPSKKPGWKGKFKRK